jgi:hypothetical protein
VTQALGLGLMIVPEPVKNPNNTTRTTTKPERSRKNQPPNLRRRISRDVIATQNFRSSLINDGYPRDFSI